MDKIENYKSAAGRFEPVWTLEIQTIAGDVDALLDAVMEVYPLSYGRYQRNASVTAAGYETSQPEAGSTTTTHKPGYKPGQTERYAMVELKISLPRDLSVLEAVMGAVMQAHHYEEPVIFLREDHAARASYDPNRDNPNRWWNRPGGMGETL